MRHELVQDCYTDNYRSASVALLSFALTNGAKASPAINPTEATEI